MKRKEQYADEIIEMLERTKCGAWASNINLNTKDRVIEVCQNCVDSWSGRKFKDHCTTSPQALEQNRWIPVSERLPKKNVWVLVTVVQGSGLYVEIMRIDKYKGMFTDNIGYYGSVIAWMPLPQPYELQESEVSDADSD